MQRYSQREAQARYGLPVGFSNGPLTVLTGRVVRKLLGQCDEQWALEVHCSKCKKSRWKSAYSLKTQVYRSCGEDDCRNVARREFLLFGVRVTYRTLKRDFGLSTQMVRAGLQRGQSVEELVIKNYERGKKVPA